MTNDLEIGRFEQALAAVLPSAVALRHELHAHPEIGGSEAGTVATVQAAFKPELLAGAKIDKVAGGLLIRLGESTGPAIALRAELDALPLVEETGVDWSATGTAMHACGHDVHLAGLYAAATALAEVGPPMPVLVMLQPREEVQPSGAADLVASGLLHDHEVAAVLGAHLHPGFGAGQIGLAAGPVNASVDDLGIRITGTGGHAAYPHLARDPIVAASGVVLALQQVVSRRTDPMLPTVLTVGSFHSGEASNVIPATAELRASLRAFDDELRSELIKTVTTIVQATASAYGCQSEVRAEAGEPVLVNDSGLVAAINPRLGEAGFEVVTDRRSCGSDDFAHYKAVAPSAMSFVGVGQPGSPPLHSPHFLPPDECVGRLARVLIASYLAAVEHQSWKEPTPDERT